MVVFSTVLNLMMCGDKSYFVLYKIPLMPNGISHPINSHIRVVGWLTLLKSVNRNKSRLLFSSAEMFKKAL